MLSDEEKTALEFIKINNEHKYCDKDDVDFLLNLIEKQQKEIEELKEENKKYIIKMTDEQYSKVIELVECDINKKWKDKIKAKIEELNKDFKEYENGQEWEIQDEIRGQIDVLQSLLEKE